MVTTGKVNKDTDGRPDVTIIRVDREVWRRIVDEMVVGESINDALRRMLKMDGAKRRKGKVKRA